MPGNKVNDKTSLATDPVVLIADSIKQGMEAINRQLVQIDVYNKNTSNVEFRHQYDRILSEIADFLTYIKTGAFHAVKPEDLTAIKTQVYNHLFSTQTSNNVELLCCAEALDYDQMLVAARRARLCGRKQRLLFICDLDFLKSELLQHQVTVSNVSNQGILHHYTSSSVQFDDSSDGKATFSSVSNHDVEKIVKQVFDVVPKFIKECVSSSPLKVVLRSCSGAETKEDNVDSLEETIAYPIRVLPPSMHILPGKYDSTNMSAKTKQEKPKKHTEKAASGEATLDPEQLAKINAYKNGQFTQARQLNNLAEKKKGSICIRQDKLAEGQYTTKLYLPFEEQAIVELSGFPPLENEADFAQFAKQLIEFLQANTSYHLHINPYDIRLVIENKDYTNPHSATYQNGLKRFKEAFGTEAVPSKKTPALGLLEEWENREPLKKPKAVYKQLFTSTKDLKDVAPMPKGSYASNFLAAIRDCSNVDQFKAYYAGYGAAPDRTIHAISGGSRKGVDAGDPKAFIVSRRGGFFYEEGSEQAKATQSKKEYKR